MQREFSVDRQGRGKARLKTLADLDHRTAAARRAHALVQQLETDLGGAEYLTTARRELVKRAGALSAILEDFEARWLAHERLNLADYLSGCNTQRRILTSIGLERRARLVNPVDDETMRLYERELAEFSEP
jgi:glutathione S-transferase